MSLHLVVRGDILAGRHAERFLEHGGEGGGALVAEVEGDPGDRLARDEARQRREQAGLTLPSGEAHAGLALEQAREGAAALAEILGPVVDRLMRVGILDEAAAAPRQLAVLGEG